MRQSTGPSPSTAVIWSRSSPCAPPHARWPRPAPNARPLAAAARPQRRRPWRERPDDDSLDPASNRWACVGSDSNSISRDAWNREPAPDDAGPSPLCRVRGRPPDRFLARVDWNLARVGDRNPAGLVDFAGWTRGWLRLGRAARRDLRLRVHCGRFIIYVGLRRFGPRGALGLFLGESVVAGCVRNRHGQCGRTQVALRRGQFVRPARRFVECLRRCINLRPFAGLVDLRKQIRRRGLSLRAGASARPVSPSRPWAKPGLGRAPEADRQEPSLPVRWALVRAIRLSSVRRELCYRRSSLPRRLSPGSSYPWTDRHPLWVPHRPPADRRARPESPWRPRPVLLTDSAAGAGHGGRRRPFGGASGSGLVILGQRRWRRGSGRAAGIVSRRGSQQRGCRVRGLARRRRQRHQRRFRGRGSRRRSGFRLLHVLVRRSRLRSAPVGESCSVDCGLGAGALEDAARSF